MVRTLSRAATSEQGAACEHVVPLPEGEAYSVVAPAVSKVKLSDMADQCVEIVGVLAAEGAASSATGAAGASPGMTPKTNRALNITSIRPVQGGCTQ